MSEKISWYKADKKKQAAGGAMLGISAALVGLNSKIIDSLQSFGDIELVAVAIIAGLLVGILTVTLS